MDTGELFAAFLLMAGFVVGGFIVSMCVFLGIQMAWQYVHGKSELRQEQAMAVAVAEAAISQDFNDHHALWQAWLLVYLRHADDSFVSSTHVDDTKE